MATKTVVCPECGSGVAPGRYACSACGSLLAAVSPTARRPLVEIAAEPDEPLLADDPDDDAGGGPDPRPEREPESESEPEVEGEPESGPEGGSEREPRPEPESGPEVDEDRPLAVFAATGRAAEPDATPVPPAISAWPPAGDHGADPLPERRTPAGAWLPPSARLERLSERGPAVATAAIGIGAGSGGSVAAGSAAGSSEARGAASGPGRLAASLGLAQDAPRQAIGIGAGLAAAGFLLPWANVLAGAGLLGGYFTQWGMAGPGHWIVVALLAGLAAVALAGGRFAGWPVGPAAITAAALLAGLLWPYLFGVLGRSVGVWAVLAGAIVVAVGGVLEMRIRHHPPDGAA